MSTPEREVSTTQSPHLDVPRFDQSLRRWTSEAVRRISAEGRRSSDTQLISVPLPEEWGVDLYLKPLGSHTSHPQILQQLHGGGVRQASLLR